MTIFTTARAGSNGMRIGRLLIATLVGGGLAAAANTALLIGGKAFGIAFRAPVSGPDAPLQATNLKTTPKRSLGTGAKDRGTGWRVEERAQLFIAPRLLSPSNYVKGGRYVQ